MFFDVIFLVIDNVVLHDLCVWCKVFSSSLFIFMGWGEYL